MYFIDFFSTSWMIFQLLSYIRPTNSFNPLNLMKKITLLSAILLLMVQLTFSQNISAKRIKINNPTKDQLLKVKVAGIDLACGAIFKDNSLILELGEGELDALYQQNIPYTIMVEDLIEYYKKKNEIELPIAKAALEAKKAKKLANKSLSTKSKSINNFIQYEGCTEVDWDVPTNFNLGSMMGCLTYSEMLAELDQMRALYPNLISVKTDASPGTVTHGNSYTNNGTYDTWAGQPIYYVRISDNPDTDEPNEPESLYSGMTHSREVSSMMNLIYYMWYVLENYNTDTGIKNLVDNHEMYFIPVANPDGLMWNEQIAPSGGGYQRKNLGPYNTGNNNVRGVDLNRNYDYFWGSHSIYANGGVGSSGTQSSGTYRGPSAFSEPETQIVRNFSATREFKTAMNHHAQSNLIPHSYNGYPGAPSSGREAEYHKFCHDMTRFNRYIYGEAPDILTIANGDMSDWMLGGATDLNGSNGSGQGILALAPENGAHDGSEGTFWPSATQIVDIAQRAVRMNFVNAYHSGKFAQFHDLNSSDITATAGNLEFGLEYLGQTLGDITLSIAPISPNNNIRFTSSTFDLSNDAPYTSVQSSWNKLEQRTISVPYALKTSIVDNEKIEFEITVTNDDGYVMYRANIIKTFNPNVLFQDNPDTDNLTNWTASGGTWGTTTDAYSGTKAISYAPSGSYANSQSNRRLTLNSTIDLSSSTASVIQFFAKWDLERNFDFAQIQGSTDGSTWIPLCGKYTKPGASEATNRYTSTYSSNTSTGKSTNDKNNQASAGLVYDADTMDKWVMEEIAIDATENSFLLGATNARFRFVFDSDSNNRADGYPTTFDGFSFDDFKVISLEIPCVTDVPTNVSASSITGTSTTINWDNTPSATYDLRYKESTSGTWIDVLNISTTTHNLTGLNNSTNYDVQVRSKCVNNSNYSASTQFSTAVSYCSADGDDGTYFYIDNVSFGSIDNNSTGNTSGYSNFTSLSHNLIPTGSTETISISKHYTGTQYELATSVWIDFNQDGDFTDSGEQVLSNPSSTTSPITGNITIPSNALAGTTRMRIIQKYYNITGEFANDPCESFNYGEVEDYTINIKSNDPIASCQNIDATLDATGNVTITAANLDDGTSFGDLSIDISSFTCANIGTNNVTLTATDPSDSGNTHTCVAVVTVIQQDAPTQTNCWDNYTYNYTTCVWENQGTQPAEPTTELECWETRSFNDTTCAWEVTGTQPTEPTTELECWETRSFNDTTCAWEVTGTQPTEPTTECYETATFNDTTCSWEVIDNGTGTLYYRDNDNDGFGDPSISVLDCSTPTGYITNNTDCDDTDNTIYPGAPEVTNDGIDQDCDGSDQTTLDNSTQEINLIAVTPNPFKDNVNIQLPSSLNNSDFNIKVFDLNGRLVFDRKFSSKNSQVKVTGLSKLNQAPYIFKIINIKSGATTYKRMIKN
ncbi:T9SS type A sorting domain-containing protein [Algibacter amylolyticus]|uniref:T9SS type A sorting domain-containing protein n=3 Tax=Algibacter amylolyticus TaxID=1608400 RepID=A0A5M7AWV4_9FLAO|nr:T9SS type A sorting domain-containing protein [Algibacter amylolyticus]TSJ73177.1 T9SS type A sorting domain-containing protein [Algibacter amylolyticus]